MITINLFDSSFKHLRNSSGVYSITDNRTPKYIRYVHDLPEFDGITIFTDKHIHEAKNVKSKVKIAWLVENRETNPKLYEDILQYVSTNDFHLILTYDDTLLKLHNKFVYYPFGGSWILPGNDGIYEKTKDVCMVLSDKRNTTGHKLRHKIVEEISNIDYYGSGVNKPFVYMEEILAPYKFAVVVENTKSPYYFSEKLLNCIMVGTIPIYYGASELMTLNKSGILSFNTINELKDILNSKHDYDYYLPYAVENYHKAMDFICQEDWIYNNIICRIVETESNNLKFDNIDSNDPRTMVDGHVQQYYLDNYFKAGGDSLLSSDILDLSSNSIIFDVGGYDGEYIKLVSKYDSYIYSFEPVKKYYEELKKLESNKIKTFNIALVGWKYDGYLSISKSDNSSTFLMNVGDSESEEVRAIGINKFIEDNNIEVIDLLKLNVEGSEYVLLESLIESGNINKINSLLIQFHYTFDCIEKRTYIIDKLLNSGFKHTNINYPYVWEFFKR
jgi:FkbM family methyltransferase